MPLPDDPDTFRRHWRAGGGATGDKPIRPMLAGEWKPGMPCHWTEQTRFVYWKHRIIRLLQIIHFLAGVSYMIYRGRKTIGIFTRHPALIGYQIFFLILEIISVWAITFRVLETYNVVRRNCVDLKRIPNELLITNFAYEGGRESVPEQYSNYPSVAVFIPCYNESADLVLETVYGAVNLDYPSELLQVYLCDDGKDDMKRMMITQLRNQHHNVFYVTRPDNSHAKAGNLNYAIERTKSDLVVTLDADFVARPNLLQRLVPYYYVRNPETEMYEFNTTLAVVQSPQHFRNLSPFDSDPLDQRSTFFFEMVLPGKDWWNASTMIGTTNLLSRVPLTEAGFYPYHSITEDTAMSLAFHKLGYRTFFVNESLATGLATTSLWSNLGQRARWLKGDYQILFNWKNGPLTAKGLTLIQRLLYLHMTYARLISIVHFFYDVGLVLLLVFSVSPLDAVKPAIFLIYLGTYILTGVFLRFATTAGNQGLDKSEAGSVAFEAIFRYTTLKGLFIAAFKRKNLKFKVTDKPETKESKRITLLKEQAMKDQQRLQAQRSKRTMGSDRTISDLPKIEHIPGDEGIPQNEGVVKGEAEVPSTQVHTVIDIEAHSAQSADAQPADAQSAGAQSADAKPAGVQTAAVQEADTETKPEEQSSSESASPETEDDNDKSDDDSDEITTVRYTSEMTTSNIADDEIEVSHVSRTDRSGASFYPYSDGMSFHSDAGGELSSVSTSLDDDEDTHVRKSYFRQTREERRSRRQDIRKNLKRVWFNAFWFAVLLFSIIFACIRPPQPMIDPNTLVDGRRLNVNMTSVLPVAMALGFAVMSLIPHALAVYLCFIPYVSGWTMTDLVHGRCDQYAVHPKSGKLFVPWSFISLLNLAKAIILLGSLALLAVSIFGNINPLPNSS